MRQNLKSLTPPIVARLMALHGTCMYDALAQVQSKWHPVYAFKDQLWTLGEALALPPALWCSTPHLKRCTQAT